MCNVYHIQDTKWPFVAKSWGLTGAVLFSPVGNASVTKRVRVPPTVPRSAPHIPLSVAPQGGEGGQQLLRPPLPHVGAGRRGLRGLRGRGAVPLRAGHRRRGAHAGEYAPRRMKCVRTVPGWRCWQVFAPAPQNLLPAGFMFRFYQLCFAAVQPFQFQARNDVGGL